MKENSVLNICAVIAVSLYGLTIYWDYGVTSDRVEANRVEAKAFCESPAGEAQDDPRNLQDCIPSKHILLKST
jgi:hypothetical protein